MFKLISYINSIINKYKKAKIKAVHEEDLFMILDDLDLIDKIKNCEYKCEYCNKTITMETLWGMCKKDNKIRLICSDYDCLNKLQNE